ncbi:unnamed protein product [Orchesella dallaii]|uniref:Uncharacterized protein n=1 Tax=Orchesella dallaii TaxID=48710 RepID=A0ABP1PQB3_9HEXA
MDQVNYTQRPTELGGTDDGSLPRRTKASLVRRRKKRKPITTYCTQCVPNYYFLDGMLQENITNEKISTIPDILCLSYAYVPIDQQHWKTTKNAFTTQTSLLVSTTTSHCSAGVG